VSCATSLENGFHRFRLASTGSRFETACVYCGTARVITPYADGPSGSVLGPLASRRNLKPSQLPPLIGRATRG
jgi:hypothetical protein